MKRLIIVLLFLVGYLQVGLGQPTDLNLKKIISKSCDNQHFESQNYRVRSVKVDNPYRFLPWIREKVNETEKEIETLFGQDRLFTNEKAITKAYEIIGSKRFIVKESGARIAISVITVAVENCSQNELDLVYGIYSTQILIWSNKTGHETLC
jgi:hypothetical protein